MQANDGLEGEEEEGRSCGIVAATVKFWWRTGMRDKWWRSLPEVCTVGPRRAENLQFPRSQFIPTRPDQVSEAIFFQQLHNPPFTLHYYSARAE